MMEQFEKQGVADPKSGRAGRAHDCAFGVAVVDAFGGAAGDMLLGALMDLGLKTGDLEAALRTLALPGWSMSLRQVTRAHLRCTKVDFEVAEESDHRHLKEILEIIAASGLSATVQGHAAAVFEALARAEARAHGVDLQAVHFHEVGAADAILDICGVCWALETLGIERLWVAPLPAGRGRVECAHGTMPCPVPAVTELLSGFELLPGQGQGEMLTPTAAALLAHFGEPLTKQGAPGFRSGPAGYGGGSRGSSILRIWRLYPIENQSEGRSDLDAGQGALAWPSDSSCEDLKALGLLRERVFELRCQIDDGTGEGLAFLAEQLFEAGAVDVHFYPTYMKKGRPAHTLICIIPEESGIQSVAQTMIRHSSTLGFRLESVQRWALARKMGAVSTPWGKVRIKLARREEQWVPSTEYEDCAALAREHRVALTEVQRVALDSYNQKSGGLLEGAQTEDAQKDVLI